MLSKNVVVILITGLLSSLSAVATERGGYGVGNGGDGLELSGGARPLDVVVPLPPEANEVGSFELVGVPGAGQQNFGIAQRVMEEGGALVRGGISSDSTALPLNRSVSLRPGTYVVSYSGMLAIVVVRTGQRSSIELQKLEIPASQRPLRADLRVDWSHPEDQDMFLKLGFISTSDMEVYDWCTLRRWGNAKACVAIESGDYRQLNGTSIRFMEGGRAETWDFITNEWSASNQGNVGTLQPGQFASVFPGFYAVRFTDTQSGTTWTKTGIDVR